MGEASVGRVSGGAGGTEGDLLRRIGSFAGRVRSASFAAFSPARQGLRIRVDGTPWSPDRMARGVAGAFAFATALGLSTGASATTVVRATPQGEVAQVRQVVIGFSEAVVPFGDLRQPPPFTVSCNGVAPAGSGRWSTDRVWLYDFKEALPPGSVCDLKPAAGWKPIGTALTGRTDYRFGTGGPSVIGMTPGGGMV
jgi:hypothetical protein